MVFVDVKKNSPHTLVLEDKDTIMSSVRKARRSLNTMKTTEANLDSVFHTK